MAGLRFVRRNAIALVALFIALGGAAYAGSKIGSNGIAKNAVLTKHIAPHAVRAADVKNDSLGGAQLKGVGVLGASDEASMDLDETGPGNDAVTTPMGSSRTGKIRIDAECFYAAGGNLMMAHVHLVAATAGTSLTWRNDGGDDNLITTGADEDNTILTTSGTVGDAQARSVTFTALAPNGESLAGTVHAVRSDDTPGGQDCSFAAFATGN